MEKFLRSGRFLLALPMLVFPVIHFLAPHVVAFIVPPWFPWRLFWTYFTAITIFAAGVTFVLRRISHVSAILLGIEILLFVILIHGPLLFHSKTDAWAEDSFFGPYPSRIVNAFKDFGLSGAVFVFAGGQSRGFKREGRDGFFLLGRSILGISITAFGVLHFVFPVFAPGIPPMQAGVGFPIPGHLPWVDLTGLLLIIGGLGVLMGRGKRSWVAWMAIFILVFELLDWIPRFILHPADLDGNWLKDLGIIGGLLILAEALGKKPSLASKAPESK